MKEKQSIPSVAVFFKSLWFLLWHKSLSRYLLILRANMGASIILEQIILQPVEQKMHRGENAQKPI